MTIGSVDNSGVNLLAYDEDSDKRGVLTVTGDFTNKGQFGDGVNTIAAVGGEKMTVKGTLDNSAGGAVFNIANASLTVADIDNAGTQANGSKGGFGVNFSDVQAGDTGGVLTVTGTFDNTGNLGIGNPGSTTTVTIATLDNKATGGVDIVAGTVTITTLDNAGAPSGATKAGMGVDFNAGEAGSANVTVKGTFTNTGAFEIGNSSMTTAATMTVDKLVNSGGEIVVAGAAKVQATLVLDATPTTWEGALGLSGDALVELKDNSAIKTIAAGGGIKITGPNALLADANSTTTSSGLAELATIDGNLDLESGAVVTVNGGLANDGLVKNDGGIAVDFESGATGSALFVRGTLTNTGSVGVGNEDDAGSTTATLNALDNSATGSIAIVEADVVVKGDASNAGVGTDNGIGVDVGDGDSGGSLMVEGKLTNTGQIAVGNTEGDPATTLTLGALGNEAKGSIAIINSDMVVNGDIANAGAGMTGEVQNGIGVDVEEGASGGSLKVSGEITNSGDIGVGNLSDDGSTKVTLGADGGTSTVFDNSATGSLGVENAAMTFNGDLTNAGSGKTEGIDNGIGVDYVAGATGGSLKVTGTFTNAGVFGVGNDGTGGAPSATTVTIGKLDNKAVGGVEIVSGVVTVGDVTNALGPQSFQGPPTANFIVDYPPIDNPFANLTGGTLKVTGTFANSGYVGIGTILEGNVASATTVTIHSFDNASTGGVDIHGGTVTIDEVVNLGKNTTDTPKAEIGVDAMPGEFGGNLTITGALTNTGDLTIGNTGMKKSAFAKVGALDNTGGAVLVTAGSWNTSHAELELGETPTTWVGALNVVGGYVAAESGILGSALVVMDDDAQINSIADGASIRIAGGNAFIADSGDLKSSSALEGLTKIDGDFVLEGGAKITVTGDLTNNGLTADKGGIAIDLGEEAAGTPGSNLTVDKRLTNNGDIGVGTFHDDGGTTATLGDLDNNASGSITILNAEVTVEGDLNNHGAGPGGGDDGEIDVGTVDLDDQSKPGDGSKLTVKGLLTNSGDILVGDDGTHAAPAGLSAANFVNTGLVDIDAGTAIGTVSVLGTYTQGAGAAALTNVDGVLTASKITLSGGAIDGDDLIVGAVDNTGGNIQAGQNLTSPGILSIGDGSHAGSYTQGKSGRLSELVKGAGTGQFGTIKVNGAVKLSGEFDVLTGGGFAFKKGESFEVMSFAKGKLKGTFSSIVDGQHKSSGNEVDIGDGLALKIVYDNATGAIDLDVVAAPVPHGESIATDLFVYAPPTAFAAVAGDASRFAPEASPLTAASPVSGPSGDFAFV